MMHQICIVVSTHVLQPNLLTFFGALLSVVIYAYVHKPTYPFALATISAVTKILIIVVKSLVSS